MGLFPVLGPKLTSIATSLVALFCFPKRSVLLSTCNHQQDDHQGDEHESSVQFSYKTVHVMTRILLALYSMLSREKTVVSSWN